MHTVKRAVIMAAGEGRRLRPLTLEKPKPLINVNGTRMIDTVIGALRKADIKEIYVVVGYQSQCYAELPRQYSGLTLIENPYYNTCNNISSAYVARAFLKDAILTEADFLVRNPNILRAGFERSCYFAIPGTCTSEWSLTLDAHGTIVDCQREGGGGSHRLIGMSFWTEADGLRLQTQLEQVFEREQRRDIYWDELPLFLYRSAYALGVREIGADDMMEIDTPQELIWIDPSYAAYFQTVESKNGGCD